MEPSSAINLPRLRKLFGSPKPPEHLSVLDVRHFDFDKRLTATCLQGLINRSQPRAFLVFEENVDRFWLRVYRSRYGVRFTEVADLEALAKRFGGELNGLVIYDPDMLHSANVAQTYGALHNLVPASPKVAKLLEAVGLEVREDFRARWTDRLEAYRWAVRELLPQTSRHLFGSMVIDSNWSMRELHQIRDYLMTKQAFVFDLSTRRRDREETALWDEIVDTAEYPAVLLGWHSGRSSESEYVTRAASHGLTVICSPDAANLSVHSAIPAPQSYKQRKPRRKPVLQQKVYLSFTYTDGDNIGTVSRFMAGNWRDSSRGKVPFTWEILPLALHLAPGFVEWYYRQATTNDYFIAGPSGWTYTYPSAHARLEDHLALTNLYGKALDLRSLFVMDWNPILSFRELEDPALPEKLSQGIEGAIGFAHNYSGVYGRPTSTGYIPTVFAGPDGRVPYVNSDVYFQHGEDIYSRLTDYVKGCDWRPLFVFVRARDGTHLGEIRRVLDHLDPDEYEVLRLDQFMELMLEAEDKGLYSGMSQSKERMLTEAAVQASAYWWTRHRASLDALGPFVGLDATAILKRINEPQLYFPPSVVADYVTWEAIDALFLLVRAGAFRNGAYPGQRDKAISQFMTLYADVEDVAVAQEAFAIWRDWERLSNDLDTAKLLVGRIVALSERFAPIFAPNVA